VQLVELPYAVIDQIAVGNSEIERDCKILTTNHLWHYLGFLGDTDFTIAIKEGLQEKHYNENSLLMASPNFFEFFGFPLVTGNPSKAFVNKNDLAISETAAKKYFGDKNPIGSIIKLDGSHSLMVTSVFRDIPKNSSIKTDFVISTIGYEQELNGGMIWCMGFYKVRKGANRADLAQRINKNKSRDYGVLKDFMEEQQSISVPYFVPVDQIRSGLFKERDPLYTATFSREKIEFLFIIGFVILIIAWVNYTNIVTANALTRYKEMGMRKVLGARRIHLTIQLIGESLIINFIAFIIAITLSQLLQPVLMNKGIYYDPGWSYLGFKFWMFIVLLILTGAIVSGIYPAYATTYQKFQSNVKFKSSRIIGVRKALLISQFFFTIVLISVLMAIDNQVSYLHKADLGFHSETTIIIKTPTIKTENFESNLGFFVNSLEQTYGVKAVTTSVSVPGEPYEYHWRADFIENKQTGEAQGTPSTGGVAYNFLSFYDIELLAGRGFKKNNPADSNGILLSAMAAKRLGFKNAEDATGRNIYHFILGDEKKEGRILGVYKDIELKPLYQMQENQGSLMTYDQALDGNERRMISVKLATGNIELVLQQCESMFASTFPEGTFSYYFLDDKIRQMYETDIRFKNLISVLSLVAILISCMGLFGLVSIVIIQKTKEIGIRKVLGARFIDLFASVGYRYIGLVVLSSLAASPITYLVIDSYIENFRVRMPVTYHYFLWPFLAMMLLTLLIILSRINYVARLNPSESLRDE
jgi:putative ABC transport system permease protein